MKKNLYLKAMMLMVFMLCALNGKATAGSVVKPYLIPPVTPVTTIQTPTEVSCGVYDIPVTVQDFTDVGAVSLVLNYDPAVLVYQSVTINSNLTFAASSLPVAGQFRLFGFDNDGITLGADAVLFTLHVTVQPTVHGGSVTNLNWSTDPNEHEYAGPGGSPIYVGTFNNLAWTMPARPVVNTNTLLEYCTIQAAIDAATAGNTIKVQVASHTEGPQIIVDKNITLTGLGKTSTTVYMNGNTGKSGDARGWFLVNDGITFNMRDLTLDGTGHLVFQAIRHKGNGTIIDCAFNEIKYNESGPDYSGVAIAAFSSIIPSNVDVTGCDFTQIGRVGVLFFGTGITNSTYSGCTYTGKGAGNWLDYAVEVGSGAVASISNSTVTNNQGVATSDGSSSAGSLLTTYFGPGTTAIFTGNTITNNTNGIHVGYDATDASTVIANHNKIYGNTSFGLFSEAALVNAENNWWGDATGPYNNPNNKCGLGNAVSAHVDFLPWWTTATGIDGSGTLPVHNTTQNTWYCKIQDAIDDPVTVNNDIITVAAGIYKEQVNITKGITLIGDVLNPDNVIIDGENKTTLTSDGQVRIYNPTGAVVFKGFKIINTGKRSSSDYFGILTKGSYSITVQNSKLVGHGSTVDVGSDYGLWAYGSSGELVVKDNYFTGMYHAILLERQFGASIIEDNTFDALYTGLYSGSQYGGRAIEAIVYGTTDVTSLQKVSGNTFANFKSTGVLFSGGFSGQTPRKFTNVLIENNDFNYLSSDIVNLYGAICLKNVSGTLNDSPDGGVTADIHNNYINVPSGSGIQIAGLNGNISNNNNYIVGSPYGLKANESLGPAIASTCNWWGTTVAADVSVKIVGNVTYSPWLVSGTDNAPAAKGFQPVPNSCGGTPVVMTEVVPDHIICGEMIGSIAVSWSGGSANYSVSWTGGTPVTGISGSPYTINGLAAGTYSVTVTDTYGSSATASATVQYLPVTNISDVPISYYATIQAAIDAATTTDGEVISVCAGTYPEVILVNKSLDLRGPNYGTDGNSGSRVAEAVIVPPSALNFDASPREWSDVPVVTLGVNGIKMNGFKISGDNPLITGYDFAGMNVEAGLGVFSTGNNVEFLNNVVEKFTYMGFHSAGKQVSPHYKDLVLAHNKFDNIHDVNQLGYGYAMYMQGSTGAVTNNTVTNSRTAIQVQPYDVIQSGATAPVVSNNNFSVWRNAIYYNYAELNASAWTISLNNITACLPPVNPTGRVLWAGIAAETMRATSNGGNITANIINGTGAATDANRWWGVWGLLYKGGSSTSTKVLFTDNTVSNVEIGLGFSAPADIVVTGNSLSASIRAISIQRDYSSAGVEAIIGGINNIDATGGNTINGVATSGASLANLFTIEDAITHKIDESWRGLVTVTANQLYVTTNSFAGLNTTPSIQRGIDAAGATGWTVNVGNGTPPYIESNILVNKSVTIDGESQTGVKIVPAAEDGNADNAFVNAQNGFIIAADNVTIRDLTIDGRGNSALTLNKNNFRTGIVSLDATQPGGGAWNNLHVYNVFVKYAYRRGISIFPYTVSGTLIENSRVDNTAFNHGMLLAGQSQALNNTVNHCFQGIVQALDPTTPAGLIKANGNKLSNIGNFPGCWGDQGSSVTPRYHGQPRAIQFNNSDANGRTVEIMDNVIDDIGSEGLAGTVGIYTRLANAASIVNNNTITMSSGASWAVDGGSQSVGMLLGWSYANGFTASGNHVNSSNYGMGIMVFGTGTAALPLVLEGNVLSSSSSTYSASGDGTGIYIANEYLFAGDKNESYVIIQNDNDISGFVKGIEMVKGATSTQPLTLKFLNNDASIHGNTIGIDASYGDLTVTGNDIYQNGTGIKLSAVVNLLSLTNNFIRDNTGDGVMIASGTTGTIGVINHNSITNNGGKAINSLISSAISATCNWYGTAEPASVAAGITGNVTFSPWLLDGTDTGDPGFVPGGSCSGAGSISGVFKYYDTPLTQLSDATPVALKLMQGATEIAATTTSAGAYTFTNVLPGTYEVVSTTTRTTAGGINATDAAQVNFWGTGTNAYSIEKARFYTGDGDNNLFLQSNDAAMIQGHFLTAGTAGFTRTPWTFWKAGETIGSNPGGAGNPTVTIASSSLTQDFFGLVTGDFNGSFLGLKSAAQNLYLNYGENSLVSNNAEFELPVVSESDLQVGAVSLIMDYPSDQVSIEGVNLRNDRSVPVQYAVSGDELRISWYSTNPVSVQTGESLLTLKLKTLGGASEEDIRFSLASNPLNELADGNYQVIKDAGLRIGVIKATSLPINANPLSDQLILASFPNPFNGVTNFAYSLPLKGKVILEIRDILGRKVKEVVNQLQTAGNHSITLDANSWNSGLYYATIRLIAADNTVLTQTIKIINTK